MVAPITSGNIIEVRHRGVCLGKSVLMVTRWQVLTPDAGPDYPTSINNIVTAFSGGTLLTNYRACLPTNYTLDYVEAQRLAITATGINPQRSRAGRSVLLSLAGTWGGSVTDNPSAAAGIERFSYISGKTEQGELHVGPMPTDAVVLGVITGAMQIKLAALAGNLIASVGYGGVGVLIPGAWRKGTKAAPTQPSFSQYLGASIGVNVSSEKRRRYTAFET